MKNIITIHDLNSIKDISNHVDGIILGHHIFGTRLSGSFSREEIIKTIDTYKHVDFFIMMNRIFDDHLMEAFKREIQSLKMEHIKGIILGDVGAVYEMTSLGYRNQAIYHPETLLTNHVDFNMFDDIFGAFAAKEITLETLKDISKYKKYPLFFLGHGHLSMFYSKRPLISRYEEAYQLEHHDGTYTLIEEKRPDEDLPILEDHAGTHIFRHHVMSSINVFNQLKDIVDYFVIDTIFKDDRYGIEISKLYQTISLEDANLIQDKYQEIWDEGFLFKQTTYKGKL